MNKLKNFLIIFVPSIILLFTVSMILVIVAVEESIMYHIEESCESFGAFKVNDTVYACEIRKNNE